VVDAARAAITTRLALCSSEVAEFDQHLKLLGAQLRGKKLPKDLDLLKKRVDTAVKLRESWEKAERRCQIGLGIVTERAERAAKVEKVKSGEDDFEKLQRFFSEEGELP